MSDTDEIRKLRKLCSDLERVHQENEERYGKAAETVEQLQARLNKITKHPDTPELIRQYAMGKI